MFPKQIILVLLIAITISFCKKINPSFSPLKVYKDSAFSQFFRKTSGWIAGDGAFSISLANNKVLWLFGDSYIDTYDNTTATVPCIFQVNNAGLLQQNKNDLFNSTTLTGNQPGIKSYFKLWPDGSGKQLWPGAGFQQGDSIYVYLQGIKITGSGNFSFSPSGEDYIGIIKYPEMIVTGYFPLPFMDTVFFGSAMVKDDAAGFVYAYGVKRNWLGSNVFVARFKPSKIFQLWEFWDGSGWNSNQAAKAIITQGYSYAVNVCKINDKFVWFSSYFSVGCDQGKEIHSRVAANPQGPFLNDKKIFEINDSFQGHLPFFYFPIAHPELINNKNELLLTYSINGYEPCLPVCINGRRDPDNYRPKAIRIPLSLIDESF
jgi:hypothetical protein